jgi:hypothetical protein
MKATIQSIRTLSAERDSSLAAIILQLTSVLTDDSKPADHRQRRERELRAEYSAIEADYGQRIGKAAAEAKEEPQRRLAAGSGWKPEELAEVQLLVAQYGSKSTRQERQHLVDAIRADLGAGNVAGARIKARAAEALSIPFGDLAPELHRADPVTRDASDTLSAIEGLVELVGMEPTRMRAAAGYATVPEQVRVKGLAQHLGLRWDTPLPAQVEPDYTGPTLEAGVPLNAFRERPDAEREAQQAQVERIGRDGETPADTAARYAARGGRPTGEAPQGNLPLFDK